MVKQWWNEGAFIPMQSSRVRSNEATTTRACAAASPLLNYITLHYATLHYIATTTRVCSFASPSLHYITLHYIALRCHDTRLRRREPFVNRARERIRERARAAVARQAELTARAKRETHNR